MTNMNKGLSTFTSNAALRQNSVPASFAIKSSTPVSKKNTSLPIRTKHAPTVTPLLGPCSMDISSSQSSAGSVSLDETMCTCDSLKSPDVEYINNVDNKYHGPQMCVTVACDIYKHLRASDQVPTLQLECLAYSVVDELSLLEYSMLCHSPSLTAASAVFLAKYIMLPGNRPWACATAITKVNKGLSACTSNTALCQNPVSASSALKSSTSVSRKDTNLAICTKHAPTVTPLLGPCSMDISPRQSGGGSVSLVETMSTRDSLKSPGVEYIDNADASAVASIERKASSHFHISEHMHGTSENVCKRDLIVGVDTSDKIVDVDNKYDDPQMCATIACDTYKHLLASENKKRPSTDFMDGVQNDINPSMPAIPIAWIVEVAEEYMLLPNTLTDNYIDRYLFGNGMNRQRLQLLDVACMMIEAKYEEICAPQAEEFCYITDNTYFKEEVFQMESAVLNFLKFKMTAPTTKCFLRRFAHAAKGNNELECLANCVAELSLLEYSMLCYSPLLLASSAVFLAKYILLPGNRPWNSTLAHYTQYNPSAIRKGATSSFLPQSFQQFTCY